MTFDSNLMHWVMNKPLVDNGGSLLEGYVSWRICCFLTRGVVLQFLTGGSEQNFRDQTLESCKITPIHSLKFV